MGAVFGELGAWLTFAVVLLAVAAAVLWGPAKVLIALAGAIGRSAEDKVALAEFDRMLTDQPAKACAYIKQVRDGRRPAWEKARLGALLDQYKRRYADHYQRYRDVGIL